jgi:hypothetical protein
VSRLFISPSFRPENVHLPSYFVGGGDTGVYYGSDGTESRFRARPPSWAKNKKEAGGSPRSNGTAVERARRVSFSSSFVPRPPGGYLYKDATDNDNGRTDVAWRWNIWRLRSINEFIIGGGSAHGPCMVSVVDDVDERWMVSVGIYWKLEWRGGDK